MVWLSKADAALLEALKAAVAEVEGLDWETLTGPSRKRHLVDARRRAAELRMAPLKSGKEKQCQRMINRYHGKMWWYARRVTPFSETLDYET